MKAFYFIGSLIFLLTFPTICFGTKGLHDILDQIPYSRCWLELRIFSSGKNIPTEIFESTGSGGKPLSIVSNSNNSESIPVQNSTDPCKIRGWICDYILVYYGRHVTNNSYKYFWNMLSPRRFTFLDVYENSNYFNLNHVTYFVVAISSTEEYHKLNKAALLGIMKNYFSSENYFKYRPNLSFLDLYSENMCVIFVLTNLFYPSKCSQMVEGENIFEHYDSQISNPDKFWATFDKMEKKLGQKPYLGLRTEFQSYSLDGYLISLAVRRLNGSVDQPLIPLLPFFVSDNKDIRI